MSALKDSKQIADTINRAAAGDDAAWVEIILFLCLMMLAGVVFFLKREFGHHKQKMAQRFLDVQNQCQPKYETLAVVKSDITKAEERITNLEFKQVSFKGQVAAIRRDVDEISRLIKDEILKDIKSIAEDFQFLRGQIEERNRSAYHIDSK